MTTAFTRALLCGVLLAAGATARASAGWIEDAPGRTILHVKVFELPDPCKLDPANRASAAVVQAFRRDFPARFAEVYRARYQARPDLYGNHNWDQVEIALEPFSGIVVEGVESDLLAIAGGLAADVLYINFRKSDNYIRNRFLYPLDDYLADLSPEELEFRVHPRLWPVIRRKGPDGAVHVWALPYGGTLGTVLLYRKDLFDEFKVPYPTAEWTWEDLISAAQRLTVPERGLYGIHLVRGKHESYRWMPFLWSAGGQAMEYDETNDQWRCVFDTPAAAEALDFYTRLSTEPWTNAQGRLQRGYSSKDTADSYLKWTRGQIAMIIDYVGEKVFSTMDPDLVGMAPLPKGPGGLRAGELNSRMMGLFSGIRDPAIRDAAWEFIRFYDSRAATAIRTRILVEGGLGRFVNPRYLRMFGYAAIEKMSPPGWADTFESAMATAQPEPYGRNSNYAYDLMTLPIQQAEQMALNDQLPAEPAARRAALQALLAVACRRANEEMMGTIAPADRRWRRILAAATLAIMVVTLTLLVRRIAAAFVPRGTARRGAWQFARHRWAYALLLPAVAAIALWQYLPLAQGSLMAFFDYRLLGPSTWVGLDNFGDMFFDAAWWRAVWNALRYSTLVLALTFLPPIILAVLLQEIPCGRILFRAVYYLPAVITGLVTMVLWKQFYDPGRDGLLNRIVLHIPAGAFLALGVLLLLGAGLFARRLWVHGLRPAAIAFLAGGGLLLWTCAALAAPALCPAGESIAQWLAHFPRRLLACTPEPYRWLQDPDTSMLACVLPMVWAGMGPGCLIYLAALKNIPDEYYEAADMDGATFTDKILFIVFPMLKMLIIINFVGAFIGSWYAATGNILVMTGGAAGTEVAGLHIWYKAFTFLKFGPATAMAWMLGFMLIGFTVYQLRILARVEFRATNAPAAGSRSQ